LLILNPNQTAAKGLLFQRELSALCKIDIESRYMLVAKADLPHVRQVAANVFGADAIDDVPF
jgi:hypothetical protein